MPNDDSPEPRNLPFAPGATDEEIQRERVKARALRQTAWWRRKIAAGRCHHCDGRFKPAELTMDHVVPLVRGGKSVRGNIVPACNACNARKQHGLAWEREL